MVSQTILKTEKNAYVKVSTPRGASNLIVTKFEGYEGLSESFEFSLEMFSHEPNVNLHELVGEEITVTVNIKGKDRYFNGIIGEICQAESYTQPFGSRQDQENNGVPTIYKAKVYPDFWKLNFDNGFEVFEKKSINTIAKKVLKENHIKHVKDRSSRYGRDELTYCVRYDESAFTFVSRLLERAGIFYFYEFSKDSHSMVLGDANNVYPTCHHAGKVSINQTAFSKVPFNVIYKYSFAEQFTPKSAMLNDYNFEHPRSRLKVQKDDFHGKGGRVYKYPGGYQKHHEGEKLVKLRKEELEQNALVMRGESTVPYFSAGHKFHLEKHPSREMNREYVLKRVYHHLEFNNDKEDYNYYNEFEAIPASIAYRPPQTTPKPKVFGAQTAVVIAKEGEEIWTDKYGRIKVKFHWEVSSEVNDKKASCWVRVAQGWAGKNWGMLFTPRKGQEVVVTFLNGDPDHPLVTGSVYNGDNMPPYVPDHPTISTIKSSTSKGGRGFNELRFDDKRGSEEVFIHAQKDMNVHVKNTYKQLVEQGGEIYTVKSGNRTILLDGDVCEPEEEGEGLGQGHGENEKSDAQLRREKEQEKSQTEQAQMALDQGEEENDDSDEEDGEGEGGEGGNQRSGDDILVLKRGSKFIYLKAEGEGGADFSTEINEGNYFIHIFKGDNILQIDSGAHKITIDEGNREIKLGEGNEKKEINGSITHEVTEDYTLTVGGNLSINVEGAIEMTAGADISIVAGEAMEVEVGEEMEVSVGEAMEVEIGEEMELTVGGAMEVEIGEVMEMTVGADVDVSIGGAMEIETGEDFSLLTGGAFELLAGEVCSILTGGTISLVCGEGINALSGMNFNLLVGEESNIITGMEMSIISGLDMNHISGLGYNVLAGAEISVAAGAAVDIEAGGDLALTGGGAAELTGGGMVSVAGGVVIIG